MPSLAVLVRYCITGGLPLSSPFTNSAEVKKEIRQRIAHPRFLCESKQLNELPRIKETLRRCFLARGSLRPTVPEIGRAILNAFSDITIQIEDSGNETSPDAVVDLVEFKEIAMTKIHRARSKIKLKIDIGEDDRLTAMDWQRFLRATDQEVDAVSEYIVGAVAWLGLVEDVDCEEQFDATDNGWSFFTTQHT